LQSVFIAEDSNCETCIKTIEIIQMVAVTIDLKNAFLAMKDFNALL
jgi:hypothetical protein